MADVDRILLSSPDVGPLEREALLRAFDSGWVAPAGPELDAFEADLKAVTGWPGTVAMSSGTAALHLALLVSGVGPGDEVLVSSFTFAATANAVTYTGATPKFVDSELVSWNLDPQLLADELAAADAAGRLPAAVVAVDLYGQCADYDAIVPLCAQYGVPLVQDAAEALGSSHGGRAAGTAGDIGILSFNGNKIITTSGGGALLSPDPAVADRVRYLSTQARQPAVHYEHTDVGFNYRLSNLRAAMGRAQLSRLPAMSARRLAINEHYRRELADVSGLAFMPIAPWSTEAEGGHWNGWLTCVTFDDPAQRDAVHAALSAADIESRPLWKPMHLQPVFRHSKVCGGTVSEQLFNHGLCLPSGSALTDRQFDRIVKTVRSVVE